MAQWRGARGAGRNPETLVSLTFTPRDGGTDPELVQTGFAQEEFRVRHDEGWNSSFTSLDSALKGRPKPQAFGPILSGVPLSNYVRAARIAFEEKGIGYELKVCRPQTPEALAAHPWGKIPALRLGERRLFETSAILRYIDESFPGPR